MPPCRQPCRPGASRRDRTRKALGLIHHLGRYRVLGFEKCKQTLETTPRASDWMSSSMPKGTGSSSSAVDAKAEPQHAKFHLAETNMAVALGSQPSTCHLHEAMSSRPRCSGSSIILRHWTPIGPLSLPESSEARGSGVYHHPAWPVNFKETLNLHQVSVIAGQLSRGPGS